MKESIKLLRKNYFAQECLIYANARVCVRERERERERERVRSERASAGFCEWRERLKEVRARVRGGWPIARVLTHVCVCLRAMHAASIHESSRSH